MLLASRYTSFFSTHQFYEGVRTTLGIMVPVLVAARFDEIGWGLAMATGALCVSLADNAGPLHHRINGMLAAIGFMLLTSLATGYALPYPWFTMFLLGIFGFCFSMIGVFGTRAASIGTSVLVAITLQLTESELGIWQNALLTAAGGGWYFLLSIALYRMRPYKLAQQVLGDCITETAHFLQLKAGFYANKPDYQDMYNQLLHAQAEVHNKQQTVREILFKTRSIVKESTHTGRVLVMAFLETVDLFELIMTSAHDYRLLHAHLHHTELLSALGKALNQQAEMLHDIGRAIQENKPYTATHEIKTTLHTLEQLYTAARKKYMDADNATAFNQMRHILDSLLLIYQKLENLARYSTYHKNIAINRQIDYKRFVVPSYIQGRMLLDNLHFNSNIFRYAMRMALAIIAGFALSLYLPVGHSYWILLTLVVILKPAYALTQKRNRERLLGTLGGLLAAIPVLLLIHSKGWLLLILICCMTGAFSLMRIRYALSVALLTLYVLVAIYLLQPGDYVPVFKDRLLDTLAGSLIALLFTHIMPPIWERSQIIPLLQKTIESSKFYFEYIAGAFLGKTIEISQYKWYRKENYVALANLSETFQRMLNEPKSRQPRGTYMHPLIVSCHVLTSRIATLSGYSRQWGNDIQHPQFETITTAIKERLDYAAQILQAPHHHPADYPAKVLPWSIWEHTLHLQLSDTPAHALIEERKKQLTATLLQLEAIATLAGDIMTMSRQMLIENKATD